MNNPKNNPKSNPKKMPKRKKKVKKNKKIQFSGENKSSKNLILVGGAIILVVILSAVIFSTLSSLFSTETYYVLNQNVKAKQLITPDMVATRETAEGTGPRNSIPMEYIQRGGVYSRYPLYAGDVISISNTGPLSGQSLGIPDDWSVTSFSINSTDAVGGTIVKGDYIDIIGIDDMGAKYIFNNLLILDAKFVNEEYGENTEGHTIVGETIHYTIGMPAVDIAYFHSALHVYADGIKIIKAPYELNYADRDISDLNDIFLYDYFIDNIDLIEGTDPTFTDVERDAEGRPIKSTIEINKDNQSEKNNDENNESQDNNENQDNYNIDNELDYENNLEPDSSVYNEEDTLGNNEDNEEDNLGNNEDLTANTKDTNE